MGLANSIFPLVLSYFTVLLFFIFFTVLSCVLVPTSEVASRFSSVIEWPMSTGDGDAVGSLETEEIVGGDVKL